MFGYIAANLNDLNAAEKQRYQAAYCGLCRALKQQFGQTCRLCLTYDMTFLALLLNSLYEPAEQSGTLRCALHPVKPHSFTSSAYTNYAASLSIALAYHKCLDDWDDDHSLPAKAYSQLLTKPYQTVAKQLPRQCQAIEQKLAEIRKIENDSHNSALNNDSSPDEAAKAFGALLGELFVYEPDIWSASLYQFGEELGRFIYFMDAVCDLDQDIRKGSYNPLRTLELTEQDTLQALTLFAARATEVFEKLPLEQDLHLLRSVMYSGIWQKYYAMLKKKHRDS